MMIKKINFVLLFLCIVLLSSNTYAMFPINLFRPWDINLRPPKWCNTHVQVTGWGEFGLHAQGYNAEGQKVPVTQIWTPNQDALAMFKGFPADSPETNFFINVLDSPIDDGIRGNFKVFGDYEASIFGWSFRYHAPHFFTIGIHFPFYATHLKNVRFVDQTNFVTASDIIVHENLTDNFAQVVKEFDPSLNLAGWKKIGFGDIAVVVEWIRDFRQGKPVLRNVQLNARAGLTIPTGVPININDILFMPFGFDGSVGIIVGGGINVDWWDCIRAGIDAEFIHLFGNIRERRIKVNFDQTDFLLLAKTRAFKEFGFTQRFDVHAQLYDICGCGLWLGAAYQYWRHDDDSLSLCSNDFNQDVANSAQSLQGWTINQLIFKLGYDFQSIIPNCKWFKPQISGFFKVPLPGTRSIEEFTIGGTFSLSF
jgi:hypothetical protein